METQTPTSVTLKDKTASDERRVGQRESLEFCAVDHQTWSTGSRRSHEDISLEECERIVLSPQPVPMNADMASEAIHAAARRSNSSRTHSIKTQHLDSHGDASSDIQSQLSDQDLRQPMTKIHSLQLHSDIGRRRFAWRRFFCCFVRPSKTYRLDKKRSSPAAVTATAVTATTPPAATKNGETPYEDTRQSRTCRGEFEVGGKGQALEVTAGSHPVSPGISVGETGDQRIPTQQQQVNAGVRAPAGRVGGAPQHDSSPDATTTSATTPATQSSHSARVYSSLKITFPRVSNSKRTVLPGASSQTASPSEAHPSPTTQKTPEVVTQASSPSRQVDDHPGLTIGSGALSDWHEDGVGGGGDNATQVDSRGDAVSNGATSSAYATCDSSSETLGFMALNKDLLGEVPLDCVNKKCLVLDLDETLVHSWFKYVDNANFVVPVEIDGNRNQIYVCKRPHLDEFLQAVGPLFECVMFTASLRVYADPVCDYIDKAGHFDHRLFRESCVYHQNNFIKDISLLGRDVDQICIVDNSPVSFLFQPDNALQITSWFDDPNDRALLDLIPYLTALAKSDTVVDYLREFQPPANAAIAQPCTPAWLLYYPSISLGDHEEAMPAGASIDQSDERYGGPAYSEQEEAVLSPHFHPPTNPPLTLSPTTTTATSPSSSMLPQQQYLPVTYGHYHRVSALPLSAASTSFVHQVTQPSESL